MDERKDILSQITTDQYENPYRKRIVKMVGRIEDTKFLIQIHTILKKHIEKRGG